MKRNILFLGCLFFIFSCKSNDDQDFRKLTDAYFQDKNELEPLNATLNGQNQYNDQFVFEMTNSYRKKQANFVNKYQKKLDSIPFDSLDEEEQLSYGIIKWETNILKDVLKTRANLMPLHQFWGTHLTMTQFASGTGAQPFKTEKDYRNFLKRIDNYSVWIDSAIVYMRKGIKEKRVLPKALTLKVIPQFEEQITKKVEDNIFYSSLGMFPKNLSATVKKELQQDFSQSIQHKLIPQYKKMVRFLRNEYLPASRKSSGIGSLPDGGNLYRLYAKMWTTTDKSPEAIHQLGLLEVARIKDQMQKIKKAVGFKGNMTAFFEYVRNKKELIPFVKPEQVIANFKAIHEKIKPNVNKLFSLQPKTPFEVRRVEVFREKTASAEYVQGSADGSRPGIFYVPIPDVMKYNYYGDEDLFLHEAIPGHHFQIALQQENTKLPDFRRFNWFGAYGEGWALYTESLGKELGLYQDPYQYFGMLGNEMHRAIRLVVDTGLHYKGWTREQAIQYSLENEAESKTSIISEIERYMAVPGQALSYKIGQLKIIELRERAQAQMKEKFDIKVFHQKVLESGVLPLSLLEAKIEKWVKN
ncbi:hypothetical protein FCOL_04280 [Flavobacterium columnare ATCC 49512]|uniref:DUF885 domain-containing protein n=1 Tax=Flavobacterium columnare (strain ATCC 49512 / CIP 103533 / TG 44/87) TaxID=1041826 RepID=G8X7H7_FLACA|nr:DUF885 domain-containing protein [Flavobacterium columnare]AEW85690.1 hypothetical protein FCOL_04280 [Flavobacterium columnare ATCC 49512]MBF6656387.1 DUF885 domain-containing protein [Flavobacterium columnare]MBF6657608.1 DUF885 domain-containing protein [Flavobacterium columnare]